MGYSLHMERESRTLELNGTTYVVTLLGGKKATEVCGRMLDMISKWSSKEDATKELLSKDFLYFVDLFAAHTSVTMGTKSPRLADVYDVHFAGDRMGDMMQWLVFCLLENFGGFLGAMPGIIATLGERLKAFRSTSPKG